MAHAGQDRCRVASEKAPDPVGLALGVDENDHAGVFEAPHQADQQRIFSSLATM